MSASRLEYESYAVNGYVKMVLYENSGGYLVIHPEHGQNEWEENKRIGQMLAELGDAVVLLPNTEGRPSPDALRNGEEWEFKTIQAFNLKNAVQNALRKGKTQSANIICFVNMLYTLENITLGIYNAIKFDKEGRIANIGILFRDGRLVEISREDVMSRRFIRKFYQKTKEDEHSPEPPF